MSLIRMAARLTAVAALRDRTMAGARVYDSDNTPLAQALSKSTDTSGPYIVVFTDNDNVTELGDRDLTGGNRNLFLVLEIGVARAVVVHGVTEIHFPATDAGMEAAIDAIEYQAQQALFIDPRSEWGEIMRHLVTEVVRRPSVRGAGAPERGARWAARQVTYVCETISDPPMGTVIRSGHALRRFIAKARADTAVMLAPAAGFIEGLLTTDVGAYPSWEQAQAMMGSTKEGIRAMGLAPLVETPAGSSIVTQEDGADVDNVVTHEGPGLIEIDIAQENDGTTAVIEEDQEGVVAVERGDSAAIVGTVT